MTATTTFNLLAAQGATGDTNAWAIVIIVVIALLVLAGGILLAKKVFTRGTMAAKPSDDAAHSPDQSSVGAGDEPGVVADPTAVGRPSDRGYEQNP